MTSRIRTVSARAACCRRPGRCRRGRPAVCRARPAPDHFSFRGAFAEYVVADADRLVAIPDADQTPEQIAGLAEGVALESQFARRLAESGCRVLVPVLVDRRTAKRGNPPRGATLTSREYIYRSAFELGRLEGHGQEVLEGREHQPLLRGRSQAHFGGHVGEAQHRHS